LQRRRAAAFPQPIDYSRLKIYYSLCMYRRPKFLEVLHEIREEMSREADYDMEAFAEIIRNEEGKRQKEKGKNIKDDERLTGDDRPLTTVYGNRF
jgi:rRNA maturation endonuclease Nob1